MELMLRQEPQKHLLTVIQKVPQKEIHHPDIVNQTNTIISTERENVKVRNYLNQQIGDIELVQIPVRTVMPVRKTGLTNQTEAQEEDMTPVHVKAGTTYMLRGTTNQTGPKSLHQTFYIVQLPLMTRKGEVEKGDKIKSRCPHQTLNMV